MAVLAPVTDRLTKLIPRLASDHDGEVVATARAIGRTLTNAGLDFHALAGALQEPEPKVLVVYRDRPVATPQPPTLATLSHHERLAWLAAMAASGTLTAWEQVFVADLHQQHRCRPDRGLTVKQRRSLDLILASSWMKGVRP